MGCGCGERRQIGGNLIRAFKRGDTGAMRQHMGEMASSLGHDISSGRVGLSRNWQQAAQPIEEPMEPRSYHVRKF